MALLTPTPQLIAMRAAAIEGACGPWSTAATSAASRSLRRRRMWQLTARQQIDHVGKAGAADQVFDGIATEADHPRPHVDDGCRHQSSGVLGERLVVTGRSSMMLSCASCSISLRSSRSRPAVVGVRAERGGGEAGVGSPLPIDREAGAHDRAPRDRRPGTSAKRMQQHRARRSADAPAPRARSAPRPPARRPR